MTGHVAGYAILAACIALVILAIIAIASRRHRAQAGRLAVRLVAGLIATYLVARGIVEFFIVHYGDPASYHDSWGGPSLAGVFAVHSGPGFLILFGAAVCLVRRSRGRDTRPLTPASGSADTARPAL